MDASKYSYENNLARYREPFPHITVGQIRKLFPDYILQMRRGTNDLRPIPRSMDDRRVFRLCPVIYSGAEHREIYPNSASAFVIAEFEGAR